MCALLAACMLLSGCTLNVPLDESKPTESESRSITLEGESVPSESGSDENVNSQQDSAVESTASGETEPPSEDGNSSNIVPAARTFSEVLLENNQEN